MSSRTSFIVSLVLALVGVGFPIGAQQTPKIQHSGGGRAGELAIDLQADRGVDRVATRRRPASQ